MNKGTRQAAYAVAWQQRDGIRVLALPAPDLEMGAGMFAALAANYKVMSAELHEQLPDGSAIVLASTRDGSEDVCARCCSMIRAGGLHWKGYPYCAVCAQRIEDELTA